MKNIIESIILEIYKGFEEIEKPLYTIEEHEDNVELSFDGLLYEMLNGDFEFGDPWKYRNKFEQLCENNNLDFEFETASLIYFYKK